MINESSLLYWWPRIQHLKISMPRTEILPVSREPFLKAIDPPHTAAEKYYQAIKETARKIGYPLFLRTDLVSGKHDWKNSCYVEREEDLISHVFSVIEFNETADILGLDWKALVFREFIELDWKFKAFWGEMPVARARRYFIKDGQVLCHHSYWIEDAIAQSGFKPKEPDWRDLLKQLNFQTKKEVKLLSEYATEVASVLSGFLSVDFAHAKDGRWILIDIALGKESWHPERCPKRKRGF